MTTYCFAHDIYGECDKCKKLGWKQSPPDASPDPIEGVGSGVSEAVGEFQPTGYCAECGMEMNFESCHACFGEGGFHDCGDDTCACLDKSVNVMCEDCKGHGEYYICPDAESHYKETKSQPEPVKGGVKSQSGCFTLNEGDW